MSEEQIRSVVLSLLARIAPEADLGAILPDRRFRDQMEFDSVDFLAFALSLQQEFKVPIPENDFPRLATLNGCIEYLRARGEGL
jgi:acyl carrier protein